MYSDRSHLDSFDTQQTWKHHMLHCCIWTIHSISMRNLHHPQQKTTQHKNNPKRILGGYPTSHLTYPGHNSSTYRAKKPRTSFFPELFFLKSQLAPEDSQACSSIRSRVIVKPTADRYTLVSKKLFYLPPQLSYTFLYIFGQQIQVAAALCWYAEGVTSFSQR